MSSDGRVKAEVWVAVSVSELLDTQDCHLRFAKTLQAKRGRLFGVRFRSGRLTEKRSKFGRKKESCLTD